MYALSTGLIARYSDVRLSTDLIARYSDVRPIDWFDCEVFKCTPLSTGLIARYSNVRPYRLV